jgi:phosphatidylserine/phosphatidylglycerophosphate/cardiolipin synthase-like enzyme
MRLGTWLFCVVLPVLGCAGSSGISSSDDDLEAASRASHPSHPPPPGSGTFGPNTSPDVRIIPEPSDNGAALVAAIQAATRSVHVTMYLLTAPEVLNALVARHQAGVDVQVVLNEKFDTSGNSNQASFDTLHAAGVPVVWAPSTFSFTHEKCVVIDGTTAWIMTMNSAKSSFDKNREFLAIDTTPADVAEAEAQFAADFANQPFTPSGDLLVSPVNSRVGIVGLIDGATRTLDFEVEELSDAGVVTALCNASSRHVVVRGALSTEARSQTGDRALEQLKGCGIAMVSLKKPYLHAKAIIADGTRIYVGSANFSATSLDRNRELAVVTENAQAVQTVSPVVAGDIATGTAL